MINMRLAKERGLVEEDIEAIKSIYEELEKMLETAHYTNYSESVYIEIEHLEYQLQGLWGFHKDSSYHTWKHLYKFKCQWVGRKFRCTRTEEEFTIPNSVEERDFYSFGKAFVDVGRLDGYSRFSNCKEVEGM